MRISRLVAILGLFLFSSTALAGDMATPADVHKLVVSAYDVVKVLKDEALPAFNDPKGEFVYKDTYVFVLQCPQYVVAHPFALEKLKGKDLRKDFPFQVSLCEAGKDSDGSWVEYEWPKPGSTEPSRKVSFSIHVAGTPYTVVAGVYNDTDSIEDLNRKFIK